MFEKSYLERKKKELLVKIGECRRRQNRAKSALVSGGRNAIPIDLPERASRAGLEFLYGRMGQNYTKVENASRDAIARIAVGTYGICEECGEPISKKRLEAVPWARHCIPCKEKIARERAMKRPVLPDLRSRAAAGHYAYR